MIIWLILFTERMFLLPVSMERHLQKAPQSCLGSDRGYHCYFTFDLRYTLSALGIKQHGRKDGSYHSGSIIVAVILVVAVSAVCNFKQSGQFEKLSQ